MKSRSRTSADLREMLFQQMEAIQSGDADPVTAGALCRLSSEIVKTAKLELEFARDARAAGRPDIGVMPIVLAEGGREVAAIPQRVLKQPALPQERKCLRCQKSFLSSGAANRMCDACRNESAGVEHSLAGP